MIPRIKFLSLCLGAGVLLWLASPSLARAGDDVVSGGEPIETVDTVKVIFTKGFNQYFEPNDLEALVANPKIVSPNGLTIKVLDLTASSATVTFGFGQYEGNGCAIKCRIRVTASAGLARSEETIRVELPAVLGFAFRHGATAEGYGDGLTFRVKVWESQEAHDAAKAQAAKAARDEADRKHGAENRASMLGKFVIGANILITICAVVVAVIFFRPKHETGQIVLKQGEPLPPVCICCGEPATTEVSQTFAWSSMSGGGVIGAIATMATRRTATLLLPLCAAHTNQKFKQVLMFGAAIALLVVQFGSGMATLSDMNLSSMITSIVCGFISFITLIVAASFAHLQCMQIDGSLVLLKRVSQRFIDVLSGRASASRTGSSRSSYGGDERTCYLCGAPMGGAPGTPRVCPDCKA